MTTALLPTDSPAALSVAVERAVELLAAGEPVALPTETVYGLAADAADPAAVVRIFEAKERPFLDPLIVHLPSRDWLERVAIVPSRGDGAPGLLVDLLLTRFWPGPLTLLLPRRVETVPDVVTAGSPLVAVRQSAHPVFRAVVERLGRPLAAPSANRFGRISPTTAAHVLAELVDRIPLVLDAGPTTHGLESTIISLAANGADGMVIVRPGPITAEMLAEFGRVLAPDAAVAGGPQAQGALAAPGQLPGHYAPRTPLVLTGLKTTAAMTRQAGKRIGLLHFSRSRSGVRPSPPAIAVEEWLTDSGDVREAATRLFAALRRLDDAGLDLIVAEPAPAHGLGVAINERLRRAAAGSGT